MKQLVSFRRDTIKQLIIHNIQTAVSVPNMKIISQKLLKVIKDLQNLRIS